MNHDSLSMETNQQLDLEPFQLSEKDPLNQPIEKSHPEEDDTFLSQPINFQEELYSPQQYKEALEKFITAIRNNDLEEAQLILANHHQRVKFDQYDLVNDTQLWRWSSLHCAVYFGLDKVFLWLLSEGADISMPTLDGWSCLTLAVWQNHQTMVTLLLGQPKIDVNFQSPKGTALHLAAIQDNAVVMKILLTHPKIILNAQNKQCQRPLDVCGQKTKQLLSRELQNVTTSNNQFLKSFRSSISTFIKLTNLSQNSLLANRPPRPPIITGIVQKVGLWGFFMYSRYLILDPESGVLAKFRREGDAPFYPKDLIPLEQIDDIRISKNQWFQRDDYTYVRITYNSQEMYIAMRFPSAAKKWFDFLKQATGYHKYCKSKVDQYFAMHQEKKAEQGIVALIMDYANQEVVIKDESILHQVDHLLNQKSLLNRKYNVGHLDVVSERSKWEDEGDPLRGRISLQQEDHDKVGRQHFEILKLIGKGSFGNVYKARFLKNGIIYALKQQSKQKLMKDNNLKYALGENKILRRTYCPFLINMHYAFQVSFAISIFKTHQNLYLVTDYCSNGDLSKYITQGVRINEITAKYLIAQIIIAIDYLHQKNIIYRDLKPENLIIDDQGFLKLIDFGLSKEGRTVNFVALSFCGSPAYLAPEIIKGDGATKCTDIYSIGTLLYEMLTGYPPHFCTKMDKLLYDIRHKPVEVPRTLSRPAQDLLSRILHKSPNKRLGSKSIEDVKRHIFFTEIEWIKIATRKFMPPKLEMRLDIQAKEQYDQKISQLDLPQDVDYAEDDNVKENFLPGWNFSH